MLPATSVVAKSILVPGQAGETLLRPRVWAPFGKGFEHQESGFVCDNGNQIKAQRGVTQTVELNQTRPEPIVAVCESRAEDVTGAADGDYSLYLDLIYVDNTPLWGQTANFSTGTHDWQRRQVVVLPEKPVKRVSFYMLLRGHGGKAWFRNPQLPAFYRIGYNSGTGELYLAYDFGLTAEKPSATVRFHIFGFDPQWGFRAALARYYEICPESFRCRIPQQGLWMPFAKISAVQGWEDFGFRFKEGNDETKWDDQHGILTFRYTEPMTWWMSMPRATSRTMEVALAEARRLADQGRPEAKALFTSGYHDAEGRFVARLLDTPWCNGAVWSMNSTPGVAGAVTDFRNKWSPAIQEKLYGPQRAGDLDGEYIDSAEGYVTDELDFRRDHFAAATTPLVFSPEEHRPAIFRGLIAFEYIRGIQRDIHRQDKFMMANGAPGRLSWLAPLLDVMGTETDWHPRGGKWQPMSDAELLYRRALCKGKPFCFLMNTRFEDFSSDLVEKYLKRCLAYGMFPGFFSADASGGQYFARPELYNRDRPLFKRYVPLCKQVAEAGWEPIPLAHTDDEHVYIERFGSRYYTLFNDSREKRTVTIRVDGRTALSGRELLSGRAVVWHNGKTQFSLDGEDVAVIEIP